MAFANWVANVLSGFMKPKRITINWSEWNGQSTDVGTRVAASRRGSSAKKARAQRRATRSPKAKGEKQVHLTISKYCC